MFGGIVLTYYRIKNFKSLKDVGFAPTNLNLLLGLNSMGKSSVIQSLLLLRQSYHKYRNLKKLLTKDESGLVSLGKSQDVFFQDASEKERLEYELNFGGKQNKLSYVYKNDLDYFSLAEQELNFLTKEKFVQFKFSFLAGGSHFPVHGLYKARFVFARHKYFGKCRRKRTCFSCRKRTE